MTNMYIVTESNKQWIPVPLSPLEKVGHSIPTGRKEPSLLSEIAMTEVWYRCTYIACIRIMPQIRLPSTGEIK